jgi:pimeloyl-ACP methyl ester carboxylesterase
MTTTAPSSDVPARIQKRRRPGWQRFVIVIGILVASVLILTLASVATNAIISASERATIEPYGQKVSLPAGELNVYRNDGHGPTLVMLSGFGTPAPAVDFAPLIRELDDFDVIVIEGFGYGYSDLAVADRTVENITSEVHETLKQLGVASPVILLGHSVGGMYARYYANTYPTEVSAIIGIDPTPATATTLAVDEPSTTESDLVELGVFRLITLISPNSIQPPGDAYTQSERDQITALTNWNYGNVSNSDEWAHITANSTMVSTLPLPADLPVLQFLATATIASNPDWLPAHEAELSAVTTHEIQILDGDHYLHWTQSPAIAQAIRAFLDASVSQGNGSDR